MKLQQIDEMKPLLHNAQNVQYDNMNKSILIRLIDRNLVWYIATKYEYI